MPIPTALAYSKDAQNIVLCFATDIKIRPMPTLQLTLNILKTLYQISFDVVFACRTAPKSFRLKIFSKMNDSKASFR